MVEPLASWVGYGFIYTMYLSERPRKYCHWWNLWLLRHRFSGWTAVTNSVDPGGLLLVLIIFAWTPPHFWALALERKEEYADVGMPMLPVTHGDAFTRLHILLYTILLVIASVLPFVIAMSGPIYLAGALALGQGFCIGPSSCFVTTTRRRLWKPSATRLFIWARYLC